MINTPKTRSHWRETTNLKAAAANHSDDERPSIPSNQVEMV
jgi:hypothetical protein